MNADRHTTRFQPLIGHWTAGICVNQDGSLLAIRHETGLAAELAGARATIGAHSGDNALDRSLSNPRIEIWDHFVRQDRQNMAPLPEVENWYGDRFDVAYG